MADVDRTSLDPPPPYSEAIATTPKAGGGTQSSVSQARTTDPTPRKKPFWKKPLILCMIVLLGIAIVVGVTVGAVVGPKPPTSVGSSRSQSGVTSSYYYYPSTTTAYSASSIYDWYPGSPTASPTPEPPTLLNNQSIIARDFGGASGSEWGLIAWDLKEDRTLWIQESSGGEWKKVLDRKFMFAPIAVTTGDGTQMAVSIDAFTGHIVVGYYKDGSWGMGFEELCCAYFLTLPTAVSRGNGGIDIFGIDSMNMMWTISRDNGFWSEFKELGPDYGGQVSATSWDENRIDVFASGRRGVGHLWWTNEGGWADEWEELGDRSTDELDDVSFPMAVSWRSPEGDGIIDLVVHSGSSYHRTFSNGAWSDTWDIIPASHEGGLFPHTISVVSGDGVDDRPFAHMIARGDDNCVHYNSHNGTDWDNWVPLWCGENGERHEIIRRMATSAIRGEEGIIDCVVRDYSGDLMRYQVKGHVEREGAPFNDDWEVLGVGG